MIQIQRTSLPKTSARTTNK